MTGIICAMQIEADGIINRMQNTVVENNYGRQFTKGTLFGSEMVISICGEGKVNAAMCAQTMIIHYGVKEIINVGVAGSLCNELKVLDMVIATDLCQHDLIMTALGYAPGYIINLDRIYLETTSNLVNQLLDASKKFDNINVVKGRIATGDQFIAGEDERSKIRNDFDAIACEMEGGAIAQVCILNGIDFAVLRAISDSETEDFAKFAQSAAENSCNVICTMFENRSLK